MCLVSACCLLLSGCADNPSTEREVYVIRAEDTLYSIAWRYGVDFHELARWNNIGADFRIAVGQTLIVASPPQDSRPVQRSAPHAATPASPLQPVPANGSALQWAWPTVRTGAPLPVSGGGILLAGHLGQDVRAACAGRVVYSGSGIRGYGNLIIIKHGENLLSAYAHNQEPLVREGQEVALGQLIGRMGEGAPQKPALYFEIRRNGKPVDPLRFLPNIK